MIVRFGRDIYCQVCGKDDKIYADWEDKFIYHYNCERCHVRVKEIDRKPIEVWLKERMNDKK